MPANTDFFQALESRIAPYDLLTHSFYRAWTAGELTAIDLREYAAEYWHHVSAFPTYLSALHSRLEDAELRRTVLRNLVDEEGIDSPDRKPHSELWMDFANGMGASTSAVRRREVQPETKALIGTFFRLIQQDNAAVGLAALYAYESRVPAIAQQKAAGLCDHYNADAKTCRYLPCMRPPMCITRKSGSRPSPGNWSAILRRPTGLSTPRKPQPRRCGKHSMGSNACACSAWRISFLLAMK